jgi:hypothetical protein
MARFAVNVSRTRVCEASRNCWISVSMTRGLFAILVGSSCRPWEEEGRPGRLKGGQAEGRAHTVVGDHVADQVGRLLEVVLRSR